MIDPDIQLCIKEKLTEIESEHGVHILLAVESGSRAWGFESRDSDYDVRFIYKHPLEWYVTVLPYRDVIEYPILGNLDFSGWDIQKALFLLNKSNPVLFEWFQSPIVYRSEDPFVTEMRNVFPLYFSPVATIYHYLHMAQNNYREYLNRERVKTKKYFYVLRPIFACYWIEKYHSPPPMEFETVWKECRLDRDLDAIIGHLLEQKKSGQEVDEGEKIESLNRFIDRSLIHFEETVKHYDPRTKPEARVLNDLLYRLVR